MRLRTLAALGLAVAAAGILVTRLHAPGLGRSHTWTDRVTGMRFVLVRPGSFRMGTPPDERLREAQEVLHAVTITRPFYLGETEVTQAQWSRVMNTNPSHFQGCGPMCPVERVSFEDVQRFIDRLNATGERGFRLPTEAEWEFACRAGGPGAFGANRVSLSSRDANINGNFPYDAPKGTHRAQPTRVGVFPPNPLGLYDMSGNLWEWVQDEHCPYPEDAVTDPLGQCGSEHRVIRGGSWAFDGGSARCGLRYTHRPQDSGYSLGVRLARDVS
jgi:formylglycine-generating enzyme required for sulfatase activity